MKKLAVSVTALCFAAGVLASPLLAEDLKLDTDKKKYSYVLGAKLAESFAKSLNPAEADINILAIAFKDAIDGKLKMTNEEIAAVVKAGPVHMKKVFEEKKKANDAYLATNKAKKAVTTTKSGLQYSVIKSGSGESPKPTDIVVVHYKGTLTNGKKFDSSYDRGKPATFPVNRVVPGWTEVLQLMKPGDKWSVVIPPELGYGADGAGGVIGPHEILLFDIELVDIKKK